MDKDDTIGMDGDCSKVVN